MSTIIWSRCTLVDMEEMKNVWGSHISSLTVIFSYRIRLFFLPSNLLFFTFTNLSTSNSIL